MVQEIPLRHGFEAELSPEFQSAIDRFKSIAPEEHLLSIKVTPFYQRKIDEEVAAIGPGGPLFMTAYPTPERLKKTAPGEVVDFVSDIDNMPQELENILIKKYDNRVVYTPTHNCAGHCQYCFRTDILEQIHQNRELVPNFHQGLTATIDYLNANTEINEVIFSGGDPMTLNPHLLETALTRLQTETQVKNFRIHTRTIVFAPRVFKDQMTDLLAQHNVRLYFHVTHPYEIDDLVEETIQKIRNKGIRTYNQSPLLRGVNDHPDVLEALLVKLDELGTRQVSLFIADPIKYSASFRIPLERVFATIDIVNQRTSSWANASRVVLDTPVGKVRREDIASWDIQTGQILFRKKDGRTYIYPDFPKELDEPGDVAKLLWKRNDFKNSKDTSQATFGGFSSKSVV